MKTVSTDEFKKAIALANCIKSKSAAIFDYVLLDGDGQNIKILKTNGRLSCRLQVESEFEGQMCINAERLLKLLQAADADRIGLEAEMDGDKPRLAVFDGDVKYSLTTMTRDEFPDLNFSGDGDYVATANANELRTAVKECEAFSAKDDARSYLNGVWCRAAGEGRAEFDVFATDGHRMLVHPIPAAYDKAFYFFIEGDQIKPFLRFFGKNATVVITGSSGLTTISSEDGNEVVTLRNPDFEPPPVDEVIPDEESMFELKVSPEDLLKLAKKAMKIEGRSKVNVLITIEATRENVLFTLGRSESGSRMEAKVEGFFDSPKSIKMHFNCQFVIDAMSLFLGEGTRIFTGRPEHDGRLKRPFLIKNGKRLAIVMPIYL